jgi:tetratricopeptide (TPR) repeat protein
MNFQENLDPEELIRLAVAASDRNDSAQAISLLKRAVAAQPDFAHAHYLLGAEHAQLGMFERAIEDMTSALQYDPDLHAARFQLGLLLLTSRQPDKAADVWQPLDGLGPEHYLVRFRDGLIRLARDDFDGCEACLRAGVAANTENAPLNADMEKILEKIEGRGGDGTTQDTPQEETDGHLLVNAYSGYRQS